MCCQVFEGVATSDVEQTDAADEEVFNPRPGATKWVFDGEDLDAPEPKFEREFNNSVCTEFVLIVHSEGCLRFISKAFDDRRG